MVMFNPAYPGEIITEILEDQGVSLRQFAAAMNIAPSTASRILSGKVNITPEMAVKLAIVLGGDAESWLALQNNYSLSLARKNVDVTHVHKLSFTC
ncbi:HigA family addiction module antitoxin [Salmonella enterica]|uniref:HigA family addiction module antitoxin n=1 Tax=Salmonella enterica TaxID=28901 RepID=UPI0012BDB69A|nr:addiction module antidote protein, HigA family [Salmonella enterica]EBD7601116.1 HigA family addiction module antidote protein [Salmonella enterica]EHJ8972955.1 HigA family addiction module antidote protein [Salmonella enterica]EIJ9585474.1 HigA family addiction module antidote protein [Salmonella enterica]EJI4682646.1 HigA family addiction module antidote protein [Salmonella enterica]